MPVVISGTAGITTPAIDAAAGNSALTTLSVAGNNVSAVNSMGFRNRIINGDMRISQAQAGASISVSTDPSPRNFPVDRFFCSASGGGVYTAQRSTTAPAGFTNSLILTVTTADSSIAAGDVYYMCQAIEGFNVADLGWGSASAQTITLSFWVRSSITGTYSGALRNNAVNRAYAFSYTINAANTFEYKTVTITGDTSGTWTTDNSCGIFVDWDLGSGTNFNGTANAWSAGNFLRNSSGTNWIATNGATFYITGVQLEAGTVASPFERRDYGRELMMCQRYFEKSYNVDVAPGTNTAIGVYDASGSSDAGGNIINKISFAVSKRANPTVTVYTPTGTSGSWGYNRNGAVGTGTATADNIGMGGLRVYTAIGANWVVGNNAGHWIASAEL